MEIVIIGVGRFGSALAKIYETKGLRVHRVSQEDPWPSLEKPSVALLCVPTQSIPEVIMQRADSLKTTSALVSAAKGLIKKSNLTPLAFIAAKLKRAPPLLALSGPSFASELVDGLPTALVLASRHQRLIDKFSAQLSAPQLRLYKSNDPLGVELCGAFKNVYAIAAGLCEGLGYGDNARAALNTRALAEMARAVKELGGSPLTVFGLAGVGDLFLTCSSHQSRNYQFGLGLANRTPITALVEELGTIEGLWTAPVAQTLCRRHRLRTPIIDAVVSILEGHLEPKDALNKLMTGKLRGEFD